MMSIERTHSQILCITGMHRSGTSLVASWLKSCGLALDDGQVVPHGAGNVRGLHEDKEFVDLHAAALTDVEPDSKGWICKHATFIDFDHARQESATELVRRRNEKFPEWGWKDPRSVFFLEQWRRLIPGLKVLFLWRPSAQVVDSLLRRNSKAKNEGTKISLDDAVNLWKTENSLVIDYYKRHKEDCLLVPISEVLENDRVVLSHIEQHLGIKLSYQPIGALFDPAQFSRKSSLAASGASWLKSTFTLEKELKRLSDIETVCLGKES